MSEATSAVIPAGDGTQWATVVAPTHATFQSPRHASQRLRPHQSHLGLDNCTSAAWSYDVEPGDQVRLAATVKAHETYREQHQTVLVRPKRLPNEAA